MKSRRITKDDPPQFPCWIFHPHPSRRRRNGWQHFDEDPSPEPWTVAGWTHWHPDQLLAPDHPDKQEEKVEQKAPQWAIYAADAWLCKQDFTIYPGQRIELAGIIADHAYKAMNSGMIKP